MSDPVTIDKLVASHDQLMARWRAVNGKTEPLTWAVDLGIEDRVVEVQKEAAMARLVTDCGEKWTQDRSLLDPKLPATSAVWSWNTGTGGRLMLIAFVHPKHAPENLRAVVG